MPSLKIIAKIQNLKALTNVNDIIEQVDGICISRNYLANYLFKEFNYYKQKRMIRECKMHGKFIIVEGSILDSMIVSHVPHMAEINDLIKLVQDGVDAVVLKSQTLYSELGPKVVEFISQTAV